MSGDKQKEYKYGACTCCKVTDDECLYIDYQIINVCVTCAKCFLMFY